MRFTYHTNSKRSLLSLLKDYGFSDKAVERLSEKDKISLINLVRDVEINNIYRI